MKKKDKAAYCKKSKKGTHRIFLSNNKEIRISPRFDHKNRLRYVEFREFRQRNGLMKPTGGFRVCWRFIQPLIGEIKLLEDHLEKEHLEGREPEETVLRYT